MLSKHGILASPLNIRPQNNILVTIAMIAAPIETLKFPHSVLCRANDQSERNPDALKDLCGNTNGQFIPD